MSKNNENDKVIRDAQYRKGLSIAFFNATNAAIEMCKGLNIHEETTRQKIVDIRDWLLEEHKNYYATVIANVGQNYKVEDSVAKLKSAGSLDELKVSWRLLSEDERRDPEVTKIAKELKKKYEKA